MNSSFGKTLKRWREAHALTQSGLADRLRNRVTQSCISRWENDEKTPSMLIQYAVWMLLGEDECPTK